MIKKSHKFLKCLKLYNLLVELKIYFWRPSGSKDYCVNMSYYIGFNHIEFCYIILYHILYNYIFSYISYHIILFVCIHFVFVTLLFPLIFSQFLCHSLPLLLVPSHFLILSLLFHFSRHLICSFSLSLSLSLSLTLSLSISLALPPPLSLSLSLSLYFSLTHSLSLSLCVSHSLPPSATWLLSRATQVDIIDEPSFTITFLLSPTWPLLPEG